MQDGPKSYDPGDRSAEYAARVARRGSRAVERSRAPPDESTRALRVSTLALAAILLLSGWDPADRATWWLEALPVPGVVALLWITRHRFPLTPVLHAGIALSLAMLCVGAHYTFENVPLGNWLQSVFDLERNPYDRIGHVVQGVVPALAARELLVRTSLLGGSAWLSPLVVVVSLAISAAYELVEWAVAVNQGADAREFLGMQGDPWDAHWDMLCALLGAAAAVVLFGRLHDRALVRLFADAAGGEATPDALARR